MITTKYKFLFVILTMSFAGCNNPPKEESETVNINNYNIVLVPDLSNRIDPLIHPKPVHDTVLINSFINNIEVFLKTGNRQMNQRDIYSVDFMNRSALQSGLVQAEKMEINFDQFGNKSLDRSDYIRKVLKKDQAEFKRQIGALYTYSLKNNFGTDIWSYFNQNIHSSLVKTPATSEKINDNTTAIISTKNIAIILTDGYIENKNKDKGYSLPYSLIEEARIEYNKTGGNMLEFISKHPKYQIKPTSKSLKGLNVMVVEFVDRSIDSNGVSSKHPNDFEIMSAIWKKWLTDSGADSCEVYQSVKQPKEFILNVNEFMKGNVKR